MGCNSLDTRISENRWEDLHVVEFPVFNNTSTSNVMLPRDNYSSTLERIEKSRRDGERHGTRGRE